MSTSVGTLVYNIQVLNLTEVQQQADRVAKSADVASRSQQDLQVNSRQTLSLMVNGLQVFTTTQHAISSVQRALKEMSPESWVTAFLSLLSVAVNLMQVMRLLQKSTAAAASAQAIVDTLAGAWWLIPLAIAAGAMVYTASMKSYQSGGPVNQTGVYLLHKGEYVVPSNQVSYGPFYVSFNKQPSGADSDSFMRELGPRLARSLRRGA
jgi:hypothetical protein